MLKRDSVYFREIVVSSAVTRAEATIAWFCSGRKQSIKNVEIRIPSMADGEYDCTKDMQTAVNLGSIYLPKGEYKIESPIICSGILRND